MWFSTIPEGYFHGKTYSLTVEAGLILYREERRGCKSRPMKAFLLICSLYIVPLTTYSQLNNGGIYALFGVDGDTRAGYAKYGLSQGNINSDDWFFPSGNGLSIIDTTNASIVKALLQASNNIAFTRRMNVPLYTKAGNKLWLDAAYGRDYIAANNFIDSTAFTIACKNGDNPIRWVGGSTSFPNKNDLIDVFAHMRRDGVNVHDSLWLFTGVSTIGTTGSRYFDIELYKKPLNYDPSDGSFATSGTDAGHTQWKFDAAGNIIQTGDMILAVTFNPGTPPAVDVRIWVSQTTFTTVHPNYFTFGANFDGATPSFGYASILSKTGTTAFGAGISNYSATAAQDTTDATPWGTGGAGQWSAQYQSLQFVEMGLNLTRIGIDPALYSSLGINPCQSLFASIFFKSRSSSSFTSNMQDFVGPLDFLRLPVLDYTTATDTLKCNKPTGTLVVNNNTTAGFYTWSTTNGNITGTSTFGNTATINKAGTYIVNSSPAAGCPVTRTDTLIVPIDTFPPVATIHYFVTADNHFQFLGGDTAASNYWTPFGGSQGLLWNWSGPGGFSSTIQNPQNGFVPGTYQLIVTEKRNGCKDTAYQPLNFFILASNEFDVIASKQSEGVQIKWNIPQGSGYTSYEIEKSDNGTDFKTIKVMNVGADFNPNSFNIQYLDLYPYSNITYYRIKAITASGHLQYSTIVSVKYNGIITKWVVTQNGSNGIDVYTNAMSVNRISVYAMNGALLYNGQHQLNNGINHISLPVNILPHQELVISITNDNNERYTQKLIYR